MSEQVLCFPADIIGDFKGVARYVNVRELWNAVVKSDRLAWVDRAKVEDDPSWKQIIPYCVLAGHEGIFRYRRTKKGGESRLHDKWSVGVGGHINPVDGDTSIGSTAVQNAIMRELFEEVGFLDEVVSQPFGVLYDPSNAVGQVHFGLVYFICVGCGRLEFHDPALSQGLFDSVEHLRGDIDLFENWSQMVIRSLLPSKP